MTKFCNYIYLDSKIVGTAKQTIIFYNHGIFQKENTVVLLKKYKHSSNEIIKNLFENVGIKCKIIKMKDIDALEGGTIFYPFNAQSNARTVANRRMKHIFITHGESSKISSVKPIIRIYDYVATAGQAGIDRFINHKIFSQHDIDSGRLIKMGDTFVGATGLARNQQGLPCIFYAPTWEGGIAIENYSSLERIESVYTLLSKLATEYHTRQIVIRPHPNTGHRLKNYRKHLVALIKKLAENGLHIAIFGQNFKFSLREKWAFRRHAVQRTDNLAAYTAVFGLCDISAMETQMLNENIPYALYWDTERHPEALWNKQIYKPITLVHQTHGNYYWEVNSDYINIEDFKNYVIDPAITQHTHAEKIKLLLDKIQ